MKKEKLLRALGDAEDRFVEESSPENSEAVRKSIKAQKIVWFKRSIAACLAVVFATVWVWLIFPFSTTPPSVEQYKDSEYYSLIQKVNELTYRPPRYKNRLDQIGKALFPNKIIYNGSIDTDSGGSLASQTYFETTDNQEKGVIEGDLVKRSDKYIYYVNLEKGLPYVYIYSINGKGSALVAKHKLSSYTTNLKEIYLSSDCKTLTVILGFDDAKRIHTAMYSFDVSDPYNITRTNEILVRGRFVSSRLVNGRYLLFTKASLTSSKVDFSDEGSFLPQYNDSGKFISLPMEKIIMPENATDASYMSAFLVDEQSLDVADCVAMFSPPGVLYVSEKNIIGARKYIQSNDDKNAAVTRQTRTELTGLSYADGKINKLGSIDINGSVNNQYNMDEFDNTLRVVTTTEELLADSTLAYNADFYCISLSDWKIVSQKLGFAPKNEQVHSVRFTDDKAYVCTAEQKTINNIIRFDDPVFVFDLSDINNLTFKESDTIDGYSASLAAFTNDTLLGIGVDSSRNLKIDIYKENDTSVETVCSVTFENMTLCDNYKAYYIDREYGIIGVPTTVRSSVQISSAAYMFVQLSGNKLVTLYETNTTIQLWNIENQRGLYIDGYFYILSGEDFYVAEAPLIY